MLKKLSIRNFAIIENAELDFSRGLNVFTGETGAGKSIIVEALGFVLGEKTGSDAIMEGKDFAEVEAVFAVGKGAGEYSGNGKITPLPAYSPKGEFCDSQAGGGVTLKRVMFRNGRKRFYINSRAAPAALFRRAGDSLVDFHGQNEHQSLFRPATALDLLDSYASMEEKVALFGKLMERKKALENKIGSLEISSLEKEKLLDLYKFQLAEIREAALREGEEEELEEIFPKIKNADKTMSEGRAVYEEIYEDSGALGKVERAAGKLSALAETDDFFAPLAESLRLAAAAIEETALSVKDYIEKMDLDPSRVDDYMRRLDKIKTLTKKYSMSVAQLLDYIPALEKKINDLEDNETNAGEAAKELEKLESEIRAEAEKIHGERAAAAGKLSAAVRAEAGGLGFKRFSFEARVDYDESEMRSSGADEAEFFFSANPGSRARPLRQIASGGEMSRIMLAIKTVFAKADKIPVLVFDEIDSGAGSVAGRLIGEKLSFLSREKQILCVTHLPQIASFADAHFRVKKSVSQGRTRISVGKLGNAERLGEIAKMLGGRDKTSKLAIRHAEEIISESASLRPATRRSCGKQI